MMLGLCPAGSDEEMVDADDAADADADAPAEEADRTVGSGRQAAQGKVYKDQRAPKTKKSDKVQEDKGTVVKSEKEAWEQTKPEEGGDSRTRRWDRGVRAKPLVKRRRSFLRAHRRRWLGDFVSSASAHPNGRLACQRKRMCCSSAA
jgi:hypothetical protein